MTQVVVSPTDHLAEMQTRRGALVLEARGLEELAREERRDFTEIEQRQFEEIIASVGDLDRLIDREETLRGLEKASRASIRPGVKPTHDTDGEERAHPSFGDPTRRFQSFSEFLVAVRNAEISGRPLDRRLEARAGTGMNEAFPSDGGFAVQTDFLSTIWRRMYTTGQVLSRCRRINISSNANGLKLPAIAETSRATGSRYGGVQAYWLAEGGTKTASRPRMRQIELTLGKIAALVYVTDELLADASALEQYVSEAVGGELVFQVENAIIRGTGAGQPLGILNSAALVTQAAEAAQTVDTFNVANASKMYGRLWAESMGNAVWLMNQDVYQQVLQLASSNTLAFIEPGRIADAPRGSLFGRPIVPTEYNATLGDVGDVLLADLTQYIVAEKGGIQAASSIHVQFLTDETAFRFVYRVDGEPLWDSALTPFQGSNTVSPFVALAAR